MAIQSELKFLLVDDDVASRGTVREYLYTFGYDKVTEVASVGEAVKILNTQNVDFIISDWDMPGASGYSLLKLIRLQSRFQHVAFLLMSGPQDHETDKVKKAAEIGVDGYLLKPFRAARFKAILNEILSRRGMLT